MSNTLYRIYQSKVIRLAATTIVKHSEVATLMNQVLSAKGYAVDADRPETWKYYLNLAGFYHESDLDDIAAINGVSSKYKGIYPTLAHLVQAYQNKGKVVGDFAIVSGYLQGASWKTTTRSSLPAYVWNGSAWVLQTGANYSLMTVKVASGTGPVDAGFSRYLVDPSSPFNGDIAIANEYRYGGTYYKQLAERYPEKEDLILSILNPAETDIVLACEDGDILVAGGYFRRHIVDALGTRVSYQLRKEDNRDDDVLIEANEDNLIPRMQEWIKAFMIRWHNRDYVLTDDLYMASFLGVLYLYLPRVIINIRVSNCHTPQVHSYHVQEYLESHGQLGKYTPYLSLKEVLWLYRNVRYLEENSGKQEVFNAMVDNIATPSRIPIYGYSLRHNLSKLPKLSLTYSDMQEPIPRARREIINFQYLGAGPETISIAKLLEKEKAIAKGNAENLDVVAYDVSRSVINSRDNELETKLIESKMLDTTDRLPYPFADVLVNYWLFCASHGTYNGTVFVTHPVTNDRLSLTPLNAFVLALYCYNRAYANITLEKIPVVNARIIPRSATFTPSPALALKPSISEAQNVVDSKFLGVTPERTIEYWLDADTSKTIVYPEVADTVTRMYNIPYDPSATSYMVDTDYTYNTADGFYHGAALVHTQLMKRYYEVVKEENADARAQMEFAMSQLYWHDVPCTLSSLEYYSDWFEQSAISLLSLETADYASLFLNLANQLVKQATGNKSNRSEAVRNLQKAVIGVMQQFSSYGIQYVRQINDSPALLEDMKTIRIRKDNFSATSRIRVPINTFGVLGIAENAVGNHYTSQLGLTVTPTDVLP